MNEINFIDLFAGASGMSEGFINAGFTPVSHIEMNTEACETIRTRTAYHFLKSENYLELYYKYLKGNITKEKFFEKLPPEITKSTITLEINDKTIKPLFEEITN